MPLGWMPDRMRMAIFRNSERVRDAAGNDKWKWFANFRPAPQDCPVKLNATSCCRFVLALALAILLTRDAAAQGPAPTPLLSPAPVLPSQPTVESSVAHDLTKTDLEPY